MTRRLHIDCETRSEADLIKVGAWKYAEHPTTDVLMIAYALDDGPVALWDCVEDWTMPDDLRGYLADRDVVLVAHNAAFEMAIFDRVLGFMFDPDRWECTQVLALTLAFPSSLGDLSEVLGLGDKAKDSDGRRLIRKFSVPQKPTKKRPTRRFIDPSEAPEDWDKFKAYCRQDVEAEREIDRRLGPLAPPAHEWALWRLDQWINYAGLPVDVRFVDAAIKIDTEHRRRLMARAGDITGVANPNSRDQILAWLESEAVEAEDLTKATVVGLLDGLPEGRQREVLEIRLELAKSSVKKFDALYRATCDDGRLRGAFQFAGAGRTWRWAGRIFQPQNLPRGDAAINAEIDLARGVVAEGDYSLAVGMYPSVSELLASVIRPAIKAPPGKKLVIADFSSIETVMVGWAAGCERLLNVFREGRCAYKDFASRMFAVPYESVTKQMRQTAKPPVLGCGYYLGGPGLEKYAKSYRVELTAIEAKSAVDAYRSTYAEVPRFWYDLDTAARTAVVGRCPKDVGPFRFTYKEIPEVGPFLFIRLPSGRRLSYFAPLYLEDGFQSTGVGNDGTTYRPKRTSLSYMGIDQLTKKWARQFTHPGKITENIVQAISRDLLAEALVRADADPRLEIVGHVHDEILALADEDDDGALDRLLGYMRAVPEWAAGAPLNAAGYETPFYRKD